MSVALRSDAYKVFVASLAGYSVPVLDRNGVHDVFGEAFIGESMQLPADVVEQLKSDVAAQSGEWAVIESPASTQGVTKGTVLVLSCGYINTRTEYDAEGMPRSITNPVFRSRQKFSITSEGLTFVGGVEKEAFGNDTEDGVSYAWEWSS